MKRCSRNGLLVLAVLLVFATIFSVNGFAAEEVTIVDYDGFTSTIQLPVKRVVCLSASLNQILYALDAGDKLVGRDSKSSFPVEVLNLPVVARSSASPQIEAIIELKPDLIIADTMLKDDHRKKFDQFKIPVVVERPSDPERIFQTIRNFALLVEKEERGEELIAFINEYELLILDRLHKITEDDRTTVYWEWNKPFKTGSATSSVHPRIRLAGGKNICADLEGRYPQVSREYVWERNPEVIILMANRGSSVEEMKTVLEKTVDRVGIKDTSAVKNNRVYVITWDVHNGLPSIVGSLYYAKWCHPDLFVDLDPDDVYGQLLSEFFNINEHTPCVYPIDQ